MARGRSSLSALTIVAALSLTAIPAAAQSPDRIDLPNGWQPEGVTSHGSTIFAGSLADGAVWRGNVRTGDGDVFIEGQEGAMSVGMDYEEAYQRLWVAGGPTGQVRVFDARDGDLLRTYQFDAGFVNDVTTTPDGAFATDSNTQQLLFIPIEPGGGLAPEDGASTIEITGDLQYTEGFNANGIESDGGWLFVVKSNSGELFRVDPATGTSFLVDTGDLDLTAGDGLELNGSTLYVVRNQANQVQVLDLGSFGASARSLGTLESDGFDIPTTATVADDQLWAVNARFGTDPGPDVEYWITRLPLRP
jgi:hypothetical protein